jgi:hypothetical protein
VNLAEIYLIKRDIKNLWNLEKTHRLNSLKMKYALSINCLIVWEIAQGKTVQEIKPVRLGVNLSNKCICSALCVYVKDLNGVFLLKGSRNKTIFPLFGKNNVQGGEFSAKLLY